MWSADEDRRCREKPSDGVEVLLDGVACHRFYEHHRACWLENFAGMAGRSLRIAHVMQAIEVGHQVKVAAWKLSCRCDLKCHAAIDTGLDRRCTGSLDRCGM